MKMKVVIKVSMNDQRSRKKALKTVVGCLGVESAAVQGSDKDLVVVIGEGIDAVKTTTLLRKNVGFSVVRNTEKEQAKKIKAKDKIPDFTWFTNLTTTSTADQDRIPLERKCQITDFLLSTNPIFLDPRTNLSKRLIRIQGIPTFSEIASVSEDKKEEKKEEKNEDPPKPVWTAHSYAYNYCGYSTNFTVPYQHVYEVRDSNSDPCSIM